MNPFLNLRRRWSHCHEASHHNSSSGYSSRTFALAVMMVLLDLLQCGFRLAMASSTSGVEGEVARHVEMGKKLMAAGQLADALTHFHAAVDNDDEDFMVRYWRATAYLGVGKSKQALADLDEVSNSFSSS